MMDLSDLVITDVISSYIGNNAAGVVGQQNDRAHWALILKTEGQTVYRHDGKTFVSDPTHPILISAGCHYEWECRTAGEFFVINFDCTVKDGSMRRLFLTDIGEVMRQFRRIERSSMASKTVAAFSKMRSLYSILMHMTASLEKEYQPKSKADSLAPCLRFMADHYAEGTVSNDTLASLCGMSTVYFRKVFTAVYGLSPQRYFMQFRIEKAKDMLSGEHGRISEIAESLGFGSIYHFSKVFKEQVGVSPSEYAENIR